MQSPSVRGHEMHVTDAALDLLRRKLEDTRLPEAETVEDWSQGVPLAELTELLTYWRTDYQWRDAESPLFCVTAFLGDRRVTAVADPIYPPAIPRCVPARRRPGVPNAAKTL
jgi:hypothetical protein